MEFQSFGKIPRLFRDMVITEKLDGTNGQIAVFSAEQLETSTISLTPQEDVRDFINTYCLYTYIRYPQDQTENSLYLFAGSRNRWLTTQQDNYGFANWVKQNGADLIRGLGEGQHYGEWWGKGIQRGYGLNEKKFSLFNTRRWCLHNQEPQLLSIDPVTKEHKYQEKLPECCNLVPILYTGPFATTEVDAVLECLIKDGSAAVPGYMNPEGVIVYHTASGKLFKKTIEDDNKPKSQ